MPGIIGTAFGILGKVAAAPAKDAAMRRPGIVKVLKQLKLDPARPPADFESLYAFAVVEFCYGRSAPVQRFFQDTYVREAFGRSFAAGDWTALRREVHETAQRNSETGEFGPLPQGFTEEIDGFVDAFDGMVDRSRSPHETRLDTRFDTVERMLRQVIETQDKEEAHRRATEPARAAASPSWNLASDVREWFDAVKYDVQRTWELEDGSVALLTQVPTRRKGRYDRIVVLCVDGELGPHHLTLLDEQTTTEVACEGWAVARQRVSEAARRRAEVPGSRLDCYTFDELIDLEADFEPYMAWVEHEVRSRHIDTRYVPLSCKKDEMDPRTEQPVDVSTYAWSDGGLDAYVDSWLSDPAKNHLSLLGEFGMGKSWFALHLAGKMVEGWRDAKRLGQTRPRVPLVIPLRDYAKQTSISALVSEFFFTKHGILANFDVFRILNRMGRLLLIFDGFDEMASRTDRNTMVANFWELAKAVEPGAKVLLSSRTEHFPEAKEARDLFSARVTAAATAGIPQDGPTFEIVELLPFDDDQIRAMLGHLLGDDAKLDILMGHDDVRDLMRRPVMSELVIAAIPEIEQGKPIDLARIYLYAIRRKMDQDIESDRTFTSRADKLYFLCEVSWEMLESDQLSLNYRAFPERLRACFGPAVASAADLDYWEHDMRNQSMLVRNAQGDYGPSHKSLLEFFVAYRTAAELGLLRGDFLTLIPGAEEPGGQSHSWSEYFGLRRPDGTLPPLAAFSPEPAERLAEGFGSSAYNSVVFDFLGTMVGEAPDLTTRLTDVIRQTADLAAPESLGGHCAELLVATGHTLEGASLQGVDLTDFGTGSASVRARSVAGADLRGSLLGGAFLAEVDKAGADFRGAQLGDMGRFTVSDVIPDQVVLHSGGGLTVSIRRQPDLERVDFTVLHWPDGNLQEDPQRYSLPSGIDHLYKFSNLFPLGGDGWCFAQGQHLIAGPEGGEPIIRTLDRAPLSWVNWSGRSALISFGTVTLTDFRVIDTISQETIAQLPPLPGDWQQLRPFTSHGGTVYIHAQYEGSWKTLRCFPSKACWEETDTIPSQVIGRNRYAEGGFVLTGEGGEESAVLVDGERKLVFPREFVDEAVLNRLTDVNRVAFHPAGSFVVLATHDAITAWNTGDGTWQQLWHRPLLSATTDLALSADGSRLALLFASGEMSVHDFRTVEVISRCTVNEQLRGAKFSAGDFPAHVRESIELAGGVFL